MILCCSADVVKVGANQEDFLVGRPAATISTSAPRSTNRFPRRQLQSATRIFRSDKKSVWFGSSVRAEVRRLLCRREHLFRAGKKTYVISRIQDLRSMPGRSASAKGQRTRRNTQTTS